MKKTLSILITVIALSAIVSAVYYWLEIKTTPITWYQTWPSLKPEFSHDRKREAWIQKRLAAMTIEEKVGQMLMIEHKSLTPEEATGYKIGAMLHAGGQAVLKDAYELSDKCRTQTYLDLSCWNELADVYWNALQRANWNKQAQPIPVLWGTDAMHGAGAIHGATIFPHNIGLGAALLGNPDNDALIYKASEATREQVAIQGFRQIFSPAVSAARNIDWGRFYESFSENPEIISHAAYQEVLGLQQPWMNAQRQPQQIAATLKHFIGDGGTTTGTGFITTAGDKGLDPTDVPFYQPRTDRGTNEYQEGLLINLNALGYFSGLKAGAYSVMASFSSWKNGKVHGDHYLLTDILKKKLHFDGFIVSDWDAHQFVEGCTIESCPKAVNAGVDLFMISDDTGKDSWKTFFKNTLDQVKFGLIPMSRIDDAVTRILRVKYMIGLFDSDLPSHTYKAFGYTSIDQAQTSLDKYQDLSKTLAEKSMVLMKNEKHALPFKSTDFQSQPLLVAGAGLNSPQMLIGGWGLQWQGFDGQSPTPFQNPSDYPQTVTVLDALKNKGVDVCVYNAMQDCQHAAKKALVVMGEHPYAEWYGDIHDFTQNTAFKSIRPDYAHDEALVAQLKSQGYQVVTVFLSGRPLVVNALEESDAFIAAFLPGSQGGNALINLIFREQGINFEGKLPFTWPTSIYQGNVFHVMPPYFPQDLDPQERVAPADHPYPYGFGLKY